MDAIRAGLAGATIALLTLLVAPAWGEEKWTTISDPSEVRKLVSDRAIDGQYWIIYFRRDGNLAYYYVRSKAMTIRKWTVRKDGRLCMAVYSMPDRMINCVTFQRSTGTPPRYWIKTRGIGRSGFRLVLKPAQYLVKAVEAKAGPVK